MVCLLCSPSQPVSPKYLFPTSRRPSGSAERPSRAMLVRNAIWPFCTRMARAFSRTTPRPIKWFRRAAEQGNAAAQCGLGFMFVNGQGVQQDYAEAIKWFRRAAELGYADAQCSLGIGMSKCGQGVQQECAGEVKWFCRAAEQGYAGSQCNLAYMYKNGQQGVQQDYKAVKWFRRAAEQGHADAQYSHFRLGKGPAVASDSCQALTWNT